MVPLFFKFLLLCAAIAPAITQNVGVLGPDPDAVPEAGPNAPNSISTLQGSTSTSGFSSSGSGSSAESPTNATQIYYTTNLNNSRVFWPDTCGTAISALCVLDTYFPINRSHLPETDPYSTTPVGNGTVNDWVLQETQSGACQFGIYVPAGSPPPTVDLCIQTGTAMRLGVLAQFQAEGNVPKDFNMVYAGGDTMLDNYTLPFPTNITRVSINVDFNLKNDHRGYPAAATASNRSTPLIANNMTGWVLQTSF